MPMALNALTYGDAPSWVEFQGRITASRNSDPTKKMATRVTTEWVALAMARSGSSDSAAATVAISAPTMEKITTTMAANTQIAATLIPANQNSNSPKEVTENRFVAVIRSISPRDSSHSGALNQ